MRMRRPALIVAGVLLLGSLVLPFSPFRLADVILRNPIVLAAARVLGIFADNGGASPRVAAPSPAAVSDSLSDQSTAPVVKDADVKDDNVIGTQTGSGVSPQAARGQQGQVAGRSTSSAERLRAGSSSVSPRGAQVVNGVQPVPGFDLASDTVAGNPPVATGVEPPVAGQPPVSVQPPTDLQPPAGIPAPGNILGLIDGIVPPGGVLAALNPVTALLSGILPAGSVISPNGVVQLPAGIQVPAGIQLATGGQPGQLQLSPIQLGPVQTGPIQVGPGQSGSGPSGGGPSGPAQGGPVQVGPIQIGPIQINPLPR